MTLSVITTTITSTVTLGSSAYAAQLTVSNSGAILPRAFGADGVFGTVSGEGLVNDGVIAGGVRGVGVYIAGGTLLNAGTISGGVATRAGALRDSVQFGTAAATLVVDPGAVFNGNVAGNYINDTIVLASAASAGTISGLGITYTGIADVIVAPGATWALTGTNYVTSQGVVLQAGASLTNIHGLYGPVKGSGSPVQVVNLGSVSQQYDTTAAVPGSTAVSLAAGGSVTNVSTAALLGGISGYRTGDGGDGVSISGGTGMVTNAGLIEAGSGGSDFAPGGHTGNGGVGILLASGGSIDNSGTVRGGGGGEGGYIGTGGNGIDLAAGGTLVNTGDIYGGTGGLFFYQTYGGTGGAGVYLNGGTLLTAGLIAGGYPGHGGHNYGDAVQFGPTAATLIINPGATFDKQIAANGTNDTLVLAAGTFANTFAGTLAGLNSQFTGFTTMTEVAGADWTLSGANTLSPGTSLSVAGLLTVNGSGADLSDAAPVTIAAGGTLSATAGGVVEIAGVTLTGGAIAVVGTAELIVGGSTTGAIAGDILVQKGAPIIGYGTIGGVATQAVIDEGAITAAGGVLTLAGTVLGTGSLTIANGATVVAQGLLDVARITFLRGGGEDLIVATSATPTGKVSGFGFGDTIDLRALAIASVQFANGTLTLDNSAGTAIGSLLLPDDYTTANFRLHSDHQGGTDITFKAAAASLATATRRDILSPHSLSQPSAGAAPAAYPPTTGTLPIGFESMHGITDVAALWPSPNPGSG